MKKDERNQTSKKLLFSHKNFKRNKKIIGLPKIEHKKSNNTDDTNTLSFNFSHSSYNNIHNKTSPNNSPNFHNNQFIKSYFSSRTNKNLSDFNLLNEYSPKYIFSPKIKIPNLGDFHKKLMFNNQRSFKYRINNEKIKNIIPKDKEDKNEKLKEIDNIKLKEDFDSNKYNLSSYLEANKNNNKFLNQYPQKSFDDEIKIIVKKELEVIKSKRKKNKFRHSCEIPKKNDRVCIQKLEKVNFITYNNPIIQLNQSGSVPLFVEDGVIMYKLFKDTVTECNKRYNKHFVN